MKHTAYYASLMLRSAALTFLSIGLGGGLAYLAVGPAMPHDALPTAAKPLGWSYPVSCCSGYDCGEIPASAVSEGPDGYRVHLEPGDHQFVTEAITFLIPYGIVKDSPDGAYHICISAQMKLLCFFAGSKGF